MFHRVQLFTLFRNDFENLVLFEYLIQLTKSGINPILDGIDGRHFCLQCHFQTVFYANHGLGKILDREFMRLGNIFLSASANVFTFGLGTQKRFLHFGRLLFSICQFFCKSIVFFFNSFFLWHFHFLYQRVGTVIFIFRVLHCDLHVNIFQNSFDMGTSGIISREKGKIIFLCAKRQKNQWVFNISRA